MKPAAPAVMATGLYAGTTLADDGSPILLFDPAGIAEVGGVKLEAQERARAHCRRSGGRRVEGCRRCCCSAASMADAGAAPRGRRPDRGGAGGNVKDAAGQLRVQLGEAILPLAGAAAAELGDGKVRLFRLNDGSTRSAMPSPRSSISRPSTMRSSMPTGRARSAACH